MRLDLFLVEQGYAASRAKAQELVKESCVTVNGQTVTKPSLKIGDTDTVDVTRTLYPWVGRGGCKLDHALSFFDIDVAGKVCLDIGASTGGFTDVLLHNSAKQVYAVDVGSGQLHEKLVSDSRVVDLSKTDARHLTPLTPSPEIVVCDASFISLTKILPVPLSLCPAGAVLVALIKPQFEVGRKNLSRGGLVKDEALQQKVCADIKDWLQQLGWVVSGLTDSPITGGDGNREFLIIARKK